MCDLDVLLDDVELGALFVHHVGDVTEQFVQLTDGLFNVAYFRLALDDEGLLEIDVVLGCQPQLLLFLLLAEAAALLGGRSLLLQSGAGG